MSIFSSISANKPRIQDKAIGQLGVIDTMVADLGAGVLDNDSDGIGKVLANTQAGTFPNSLHCATC
jgi:hypothetical protein